MTALFQHILTRQKRLLAHPKGKPGRDTLTFPSPRGYSYPLRKDVAGYADRGAYMSGFDPKRAAATFVISTINQDRDGDIVRPSGFNETNYVKNPQWFFAHQGVQGDSQWLIPIGMAEDPDTKQLAVFKESDRVISTCFFDQHDPDAMWICGKVERGYLRATSIGFLPLKAVKIETAGGLEGFDFLEIDHLETSICGVPSNADAMRLSKGDRVSAGLRTCLECYSQPRKAWANGFTETSDVSKKWRKAAKQPQGMGESTGPDGGMLAEDQAPKKDATGSDVQAVRCPKDKYPNPEDAAAYAQSLDYDTTVLVESEGAWEFPQFPAEECQEGTSREEDIGEGCIAVICQQDIGATNASGAEPMSMQTASTTTTDKADKPCGCKGKSTETKTVTPMTEVQIEQVYLGFLRKHGFSFAEVAKSWERNKDCVSDKIGILINEGKDHDQAAAIAYAMCGEKNMQKDPSNPGTNPVDPNEDRRTKGESEDNGGDKNGKNGDKVPPGAKYAMKYKQLADSEGPNHEHPEMTKLTDKVLKAVAMHGSKAYGEDHPELDFGKVDDREETGDTPKDALDDDDEEEREEEKKELKRLQDRLAAMREQLA